MSKRRPIDQCFPVAAISGLLLLFCGCAATHHATGCATTEDVRSVDVQHGRPNRLIDGTGWVLGIPSKLALWDHRADNHDVSPETVSQVVAYLESEGLSDVTVRVNQYDPIGEWKKLATNKHIGLGWRLTAGTLETLEYTLLPGRIIGDDWYNPFTNSVHLYSDIPSMAVAEAAYAKDVRHRRHRGAYAATQIFPVVSMWHETIATREALKYIESHGTSVDREEAYRILYPSYGGSWGASVGSFVPFGHAWTRLAGALVGHAANGLRRL